METYMDAYKARLERNDKTFRAIAEELKAMGCKIFAPKDKLINFIEAQKTVNISFYLLTKFLITGGLKCV